MRHITRTCGLLLLAGFLWVMSPGLVAGATEKTGDVKPGAVQSTKRQADRGRVRPSRTPQDLPAAVQVAPGAIVRWSVPGTRRCGIAGRTWSAVQETCYYPIDIGRKPGTLTVVRHGARGSVARVRISVTPVSFGSEKVALPDIPQRSPSPADLRRNAREQAILARLWKKADGPAQFTLPLGRPLDPLPAATGFGSTWIFNTTPESSETHAGVDYAARAGAPVAAMADGRVVLARDLFYSGNSVFVDHGNGLMTGYLHLSEVKARVGQEVKKGEAIGVVGNTGRATGPHLHVAARWHGARVDPRLLLDDPAGIASITDVEAGSRTRSSTRSGLLAKRGSDARSARPMALQNVDHI